MTDNTEVLSKLAHRTILYFKENLSLNIDEDFEIQEVKSIDYLEVTTLISLTGDICGTIAMSLSSDLSYKMIENFIFEEISKDKAKALIDENVKETLNITLGNILSDLEVVKKGGTVGISIPYSLDDNMAAGKEEDGFIYLCKLKLNDENILLSYFI